MANALVSGIVTITVGVILVYNVFISTVKAQNTDGFTAGETALHGVMALAGLIGILVGTFQVFGLA